MRYDAARAVRGRSSLARKSRESYLEAHIMVRKVLNRKELREEAGAEKKSAKGKKKAKKEPAAPKKKPVKRKSRAKSAKEVRLKAFWGVFNQAMKRVALYEYSQRKQAEKRATDLSTSAKTPHFIQPVKEIIEE